MPEAVTQKSYAFEKLLCLFLSLFSPLGRETVPFRLPQRFLFLIGEKAEAAPCCHLLCVLWKLNSMKAIMLDEPRNEMAVERKEKVEKEFPKLGGRQGPLGPENGRSPQCKGSACSRPGPGRWLCRAREAGSLRPRVSYLLKEANLLSLGKARESPESKVLAVDVGKQEVIKVDQNKCRHPRCPMVSAGEVSGAQP